MSEERERFRRQIEELVSRFERDLAGTEWLTRRYPKRMRDDDREVYEVPALYLQKGPTSLLLDPIGYDLPGSEAAADIYQMPTYDPAAWVFFEGGRWMLYYALPGDGVGTPFEAEPEVEPLTAEALNRVLDSIVEHAVS